MKKSEDCVYNCSLGQSDNSAAQNDALLAEISAKVTDEFSRSNKTSNLFRSNIDGTG